MVKYVFNRDKAMGFCLSFLPVWYNNPYNEKEKALNEGVHPEREMEKIFRDCPVKFNYNITRIF
jgi:hypothetical protein